MPQQSPIRITRVHISGFKSYITRQTIDFSPLTLFFGSNASGKSSVLQALRWLGVNARNSRPDVDLVGQAAGLDIGNFRNLVANHDESLLVDIEIEFEQVSEYRTESFAIRWVIENGSAEGAGRVKELWVTDSSESGFVARATRNPQDNIGTHSVEVQADGALLEKRADLSISFTGIRLRPFGGNEGIIREYLSAYSDLLRFLSRFQFVGPHREQLPRVILSSSDQNLNNPLGISASGSDDWTRTISKLLRSNVRLNKVNFYLSELDIPYQMNFVQVPLEGLPQIALSTLPLIPYFVDRDTSVKVFAGDIGYGVSQVLPVIIAAVMAEHNFDHTMVEQPELHLHPRVQARLADLLFSPASLGKHVSVETHSEHLIYRVQKLIREKERRPEDVSVNYVERTHGGSVVHKLNISENGNFIDAWPGGFFDERMEDLL